MTFLIEPAHRRINSNPPACLPQIQRQLDSQLYLLQSAWLNAPSAGSNSLAFFDRRHPIAFHPGIPSQPTFACLQLRPQAETSVLCR